MALVGKNAPTGSFRLITLTGVDRQGQTQTIRLLGNMISTQIAAHVIAAIYRLRW